MRPIGTLVQLNTAYSYQQATIQVIHTALATTHGDAFAAAFVAEHRQDILRVARRRLCGSSELALNVGVTRPSTASSCT